MQSVEESGLRENRTFRLNERTEEGQILVHLLRLYRSETTEGPNVRRFWKFEVLERYAKKAENLKRGLAGKE